VYALFVLVTGLRDPSTMRLAIAAQKVAIAVAVADIAVQVRAVTRVPATVGRRRAHRLDAAGLRARER
jgi:hypothetical protein